MIQLCGRGGERSWRVGAIWNWRFEVYTQLVLEAQAEVMPGSPLECG